MNRIDTQYEAEKILSRADMIKKEHIIKLMKNK